VRLAVQSADNFWADLEEQVDWYRNHAGPEVATRFVNAVENTLKHLARTPGLGRLRFQDWPELAGIRSFRVSRSFLRFLILYRHDDGAMFAERLVYGGRDLPMRLRDAPSYEND